MSDAKNPMIELGRKVKGKLQDAKSKGARQQFPKDTAVKLLSLPRSAWELTDKNYNWDSEKKDLVKAK